MTAYHGKRKLCVLTGPNGTPVAENRLAIFLDEIKQHGITVPEEHIRHGDFWYSSGEQLAEDIADGRISMPEAVICASDHMALGLTTVGIKKFSDKHCKKGTAS